MAATRSLVTLKSDIAAGTPLLSPSYNFSHRPKAVRLWDTRRVNNPLSLLPRSLLATQKVLCSINPDGSTTDVSVFKKFKVDLKNWCDKQCLPVGAAAYTLVESFQSALFGLVWKLFVDRFVFHMPISELELLKPDLGIYYPLALTVAGSPFIVARSFAVKQACIYGTAYVMKRLRGNKEDILLFMVAGFVTPVVYSLVAGMRSPVIIPIGVICSLVCALIFKLIDQLQG